MIGRIACLLTIVSLLVAVAAFAQTSATAPADSAQATGTAVTNSPPPSPAPSAKKASPIYYGGNIGFTFWSDYFRISVEPLLGYKVTPKFSVGGKLRYEYLDDKRGVTDYIAHNYGGSIFSRYRFVPQAYGHAEFAYMSYDYPDGREGVPLLLLGAGVSQPMGRNAWFTVEILFDVIQDENSPYRDWEPIFSLGVGVGF